MNNPNLIEEPGGSHNRDSSKSYEFAMDSIGKFKTCKCPLHYNKGNGTEVELTKFRRHKVGNQGMCADGKTLIDSYSHQLKRLQLWFTVDEKIIETVFISFPKKYTLLTNKIKKLVIKVLQEKYTGSTTNIKLQKLTKLDYEIKTKATGFYEVDLTEKEKYEFNELLKNLLTDEIKEVLYTTQLSWIKGCYVLDSKDSKLYPVEEFGFNISKKRELYDENKNLTAFRINVHNTRAKGQRSSTLRAEQYLADGQYTEANRMMKAIGKQNKKIHADHIVSLRLGGIHDVRNLQELNSTDNIYKKDKLTKQALELIQVDITYLSRWHWKVYKQNATKPREVIEVILKKSVDDFRKKIINLSHKKKFEFIANFYPTYKNSQVERIIKKYFTKFNQDED